MGAAALLLALCGPLWPADIGTNHVLLQRVSKQVLQFWDYFPTVACTEALVQTKLDAKGKTLSVRRSNHDYLVLLQNTGGEFSIEESRIDKDTKQKGAKAPFLVTNGFSTLLLIFHPQFQGNYEFWEQPGDRIDFRHLPGHPSLSALVLKDREYPLDWKGTAWIDPGSGEITRIHAELNAPMEEIGLIKLDAEVSYKAVHFSGLAAGLWLPQTAQIDAATKRQTWRNVHQFANYRRFDVETKTGTAAPR